DCVQHDDAGERRLDQRENDPQNKANVAAPIHGRCLIQIPGYGPEVVHKDDDADGVHEEEQDIACLRIVQVQVKHQLKLGNQRIGQEQGDHEKAEKESAAPDIAPGD